MQVIRFWVEQGFQPCIKLAGVSGFSRRGTVLAIPYRGNTGLSTYFITSATYCKRSLFQTDRMAGLLIDVLFHYRDQRKYQLHEFVIMPDHFHLLITPAESLEKALQLIKGGFSYRVKKELEFIGEIWEHSFHDRRVRDANE